MDIYKDEDWYGFGIDIWFDGSYALYRRVYRRVEEGEGSIQEKIVGEGQLRDEEFTSLNTGVDTLSLSSIPKRLPDVDPRKVEIRGPAETVLLSVREDPSEELDELRIDMGADRKHYPEALLRLHERLKSLARKRITEIGD
jgi:hypothetical protein